MRLLISTAAGAAFLTTALWAQDPGAQEKLMGAQEKLMVEQKLMVELSRVAETQAKFAVRGAVMGPTVKGAPYSADEITESTQVLADGTRIHNSSQASVYRDSEGRMRRDTPEVITIFDPVEGVSYILNPKTQTGSKVQVSMTQNIRVEPGGGTTAWHYTAAAGEVRATTEPQAMAVLKDKMKAEDAAKAGKSVSVIVSDDTFTYSTGVGAGAVATSGTFSTFGGGGMPGLPVPAMRRLEISKGQTDSLGKQAIEGVMSEGSRMTRTIEAGAIGNDRPIQTVSERWYSPELQTTMMTKNSDPRSGDQTFRLSNVRRGEPGAYLFQPPAGYQINDRK